MKFPEIKNDTKLNLNALTGKRLVSVLEDRHLITLFFDDASMTEIRSFGDGLDASVHIPFDKEAKKKLKSYALEFPSVKEDMPGALEYQVALEDGKFPHTLDAVVWADEFMKLNPSVARDVMIGWFANSIMAGYDIAYQRALKNIKG